MLLILASTSRYRRELLERLGLDFQTFAPNVDETALPSEVPQDTALRLAQQKAQAAATSFPNGLILGSDQVAESEGLRLDKPGNRARAREQLLHVSGRQVTFYTAVALLESATSTVQTAVVPTHVRFRRLTGALVDRYLDREQPYDCAGSAKSEGLGIALLEQIAGNDPTALIGLPLIAVVTMLQNAGLQVP